MNVYARQKYVISHRTQKFVHESALKCMNITSPMLASIKICPHVRAFACTFVLESSLSSTDAHFHTCCLLRTFEH